MKKQVLFLIVGAILLILALVVAYRVIGERVIKADDYNKITFYKNWDNDGPFVITDKKVINQIVQRINSAPKEDLSKTTFEQGPDGRMIFEGKSKVYEVKVFSRTGNVVTNKYYIQTAIKLNEIFE
jgi:hypothetical protein